MNEEKSIPDPEIYSTYSSNKAHEKLMNKLNIAKQILEDDDTLTEEEIAETKNRIREALKPSPRTEIDGDDISWHVEVIDHGVGTVYQTQTTYRTQLPPRIEDYECPVCSCPEFTPKYSTQVPFGSREKESRLGARPAPYAISTKVISGYRCPGCTVHFDDPERFNKNA